MNKKISVVMPVFNGKNLDKNVLIVEKELKKITKKYEIIVVNDGSDIGWDEELKKLMKIKNKNIKIISYTKNRGKGYALKKGGLYASGDFIVFLDSDLDISPKNIKLFISLMNKSDVVIGSKRHSGSHVHYPLFRKIMSFFYQTMIFLLFNLSIKDTQVGIKAFKKKVLKKALPKIAIKRFAFDLELLVVINKLGFKIEEAPITLDYQFESTISPKAVFWMLWDTTAIFYRDKILNYYGLEE